jgi:hypothetical protein
MTVPRGAASVVLLAAIALGVLLGSRLFAFFAGG